MVTIKTVAEIEIMAEAGKILAGIMAELEKTVKPGITTMELDKAAEGLVLKSGSRCSFLGYNVPDDSASNRAYPSCLCTSINEEIVHAIPSGRELREGDIISLDLGIVHDGFHSDMAKTFAVGKVNEQAQKLIDVTKRALEMGILEIRPQNKIGDIGKVVQKYVEENGLNVVRELCGHGIGRELHEDPEILNYISFKKESVDNEKYKEDARIEIKEGMVLCLEPMVTLGDWRIKKSNDGFGWKTKDDSLSAHFEYTIAVTKDGYRILTA